MKNVSTFLFLLFSITTVFSQYKQPKYEKYPQERIFPQIKFDSVDAHSRLGQGNITMTGIAFTRPKNGYGFKAPLSNRIFANHIIVELFPLTPYYQEWYNLKNKKENVKRNKIVFMDNAAYRQRLTCETNERGEFTFPKMKPGKYILVGTLPWTQSGSYDQYSGSGYGTYGGKIDYYSRQYYTNTHSDFLINIVEVKADDTVAKVKLK